jgi:hypothetical protein
VWQRLVPGTCCSHAVGAEFTAARGVAECASHVIATAARVRDPATYADRIDTARHRGQQLVDGQAIPDGCAIPWRGHQLGEYPRGPVHRPD